ncbi:DUF4362 domain-containing protein [Evansella tamaricis]|uniref:DUF4362 domain-containing protein n=1 Tax=Evansella tamaricis TaxID=2069301 RepID=A0ABS6JE19_9BACI|nr:DUF4362 domain-containing protein [Evansella tamaricis]MBU9711916.1 DUF4362 domain-containing protein [Evansella tamaricis]
MLIEIDYYFSRKEDELMKKLLYFSALVVILMVLAACNEAKGETFETNIVGNPIHRMFEKPYSSDVAVKNGDVIGGSWQGNLKRFYDFLESVENGESDVIRVIFYTMEGAPIYHNLVLNEKIEYTFDATQDGYSSGTNGPDAIQTTICSGITKVTVDKEAYALTGCELPNVGEKFQLVVDQIIEEGEVVEFSDTSMVMKVDVGDYLVHVALTEETVLNGIYERGLRAGERVRAYFESQSFDTYPAEATAIRLDAIN